MAIQTQVWAKEITKHLFPNNVFMSAAMNDSAFVNNKTVNLPQVGALPSVERNRATVPATPGQRTDSVATYDISEYTSTPTVVRDLEEIETSYQKRQSVLSDHINELNRKIAEWMAYDWAPTAAANMVRTSGDNRSAFVTGATGTRKKITLDDWLSAKRLLDNMDVPEEGRFALVPSEMYNDLLEIDKILSSDYNNRGRLENGAVNRIFGINIFVRSSAVSYSNAATPVLRDPAASTLTSANAGIVMWHKDFVRRALGATKVFYNPAQAEYYGDKMSALVRAGGRKRYNNQYGVVSIIESAGA